MEFHFENVNDAFKTLVGGIYDGSIGVIERESRNGKVFQIPVPVTITYQKPWQRVLFNKARDCNPFFHVFEALWMLQGRNDVDSLAYFNSRMLEFSDDGHYLNGAYGYRWRNYTREGSSQTQNIDQLELLIQHLHKNPESRRAVLQMWNVEDDLLLIDESKDVCCNTCVYFQVNVLGQLEMTVMNRSNDLIWGTLGANVVHFSFLQEYMALRLGLLIGPYHQFTNNLHVYHNNWQPEIWLEEYKNRTAHSHNNNYTDRVRTLLPLFEDENRFHRDLKTIVEEYDTPHRYVQCREPFISEAAKMMIAYHYHKNRKYEEALQSINNMITEDWKQVCKTWIEKRRDMYEAR